MEKRSERRAVRANGKRPTMGDVAAHFGVSRALVSLVLSNAPGPSAASRERVLNAANELGYLPDTAAQTLRRGRSRHLGGSEDELIDVRCRSSIMDELLVDDVVDQDRLSCPRSSVLINPPRSCCASAA